MNRRKPISAITRTVPPYLTQSVKRILAPRSTMAVLTNHSPLAESTSHWGTRGRLPITKPATRAKVRANSVVTASAMGLYPTTMALAQKTQ